MPRRWAPRTTGGRTWSRPAPPRDARPVSPWRPWWRAGPSPAAASPTLPSLDRYVENSQSKRKLTQTLAFKKPERFTALKLKGRAALFTQTKRHKQSFAYRGFVFILQEGLKPSLTFCRDARGKDRARPGQSEPRFPASAGNTARESRACRGTPVPLQRKNKSRSTPPARRSAAAPPAAAPVHGRR